MFLCSVPCSVSRGAHSCRTHPQDGVRVQHSTGNDQPGVPTGSYRHTHLAKWPGTHTHSLYFECHIHGPERLKKWKSLIKKQWNKWYLFHTHTDWCFRGNLGFKDTHRRPTLPPKPQSTHKQENASLCALVDMVTSFSLSFQDVQYLHKHRAQK